MAITRTQIMTDLSYLQGEQTVPTSGVSDREAFIQRTVEEVYRTYAFPQTMTSATVSLTSNVATLASTYYPNGPLDVRVVNSGAQDDYVFTEIPYDESDDYKQGQYKYWLTGGDPNFVINSKDADATLTVRYQTKPPQINATITIPFDDPMVFALGALRYMRIGENPEADITQEEDNFQVKLDQMIAQSVRKGVRGRRKTLSEKSGWTTGSA